MYIYGKIDPVWDLLDYKKLSYNLDPDPILCNEYLSHGHSVDCMKIYNCFEYNLNFDFTEIKNNFKFLENMSLAVNFFKPGQYIPLHSDRYEKYKKFHSISDTKNIFRIIIFLEDSDRGQILQIEDFTTGSWAAGDWYGWDNDKSHAFYNFSKKDRYAIQLTGCLIENRQF
jgi:hypothetical protein